MTALTVPTVVTRNANHLDNRDWQSLMEFFKKEGSAAAMVAYCEKKLGIDPTTAQERIAKKEEELIKKHKDLEKEVDELAKEKAALAAPAKTP